MCCLLSKLKYWKENGDCVHSLFDATITGDLHDFWLSNKENNMQSYYCKLSDCHYRLDYLTLRETLLGVDLGLSEKEHAKVFF